jgi:large subunit ribosomal protein L5
MWSFLEKLFMVSLPRTRDFRGVSATAVDDMGNFTIGIKEHTIFPETGDEDIKDVFGLAITIVTSAGKQRDAKAFFDYMGVPFKK